MKWITALDLERWAEGLAARAEFPALVADLIRASNQSITSYRFPGGDKSQVRGFDGYLEIEQGGQPSPYFPDGTSIWEFGVGEDYLQKANKDYDKRTKEVASADRGTITFIP